MVKFSSEGCTFTSKTTLTLPQPTLSFISCPCWPHHALNTSWLAFFSSPLPTPAGFLAAAHTAFLLPSPLPLTTVTLPYTLCAQRMSKRNLINIINMYTLTERDKWFRLGGSCLNCSVESLWAGCSARKLRHPNFFSFFFFFFRKAERERSWELRRGQRFWKKVCPEEHLSSIAVQ